MLASGHRMTDDDHVFCDAAGEPLWGRHLTTLSLKALLRHADLPPIRFHNLRHTFATLQSAAGTNPKIMSEVLGHKGWASRLTATATRCRRCTPRPWPDSTSCSAGAMPPVGAAVRAPSRALRSSPNRIRAPIGAP
ncbi:MAG: tyrosine-type recombinase/integrase [Chloroflexi bacterium]|nr:tyrosine-type recombinase/integrase [Chloroflexota bacterium]